MGNAHPPCLTAKDYANRVGDSFIAKDVRDGTICYRPEYAFLGDSWWWEACRVREDMLVAPHAALCKSPDYENPHIEREYDRDEIASGHFGKLAELHRVKFDNVRFEKVMGLMIPENRDECYLYHTFAGGIEFLGISALPHNLKNQMRRTLVEGMKELAKRGIDYHDPLPSNLRCNLDGKLICNPHNCMEIGSTALPLRAQLANLATLLYTHTWVDDHEEFVRECLGDTVPAEEQEQAVGTIEGIMAEMDDIGDALELPCHWSPRWGR